jgi:ABC-type antimicrobial peptide transport system ATPase subunit
MTAIIDHYTFTITCQYCGGPVMHLADGRPTESGSRSSVVAKCTVNGCKRSWRVTTVMELVSGPDLPK